jgi:hypothetical protein
MPAKETHSADPPPDSRSKQTVRSMARARWLDSMARAATVRSLSTEYWRSPAKEHWMATVRSIGSVPPASTEHLMPTEHSIPTAHSAPIHHHHHFHLVLCS